MNRSRSSVLLPALVALLAGCGSTVANTSLSGAGTPVAEGSELAPTGDGMSFEEPASALGDAGSAAAGGLGESTTGSSSASSGSAGTTGGGSSSDAGTAGGSTAAGSSSTGGAGGAAARLGMGVTATTVKVGMVYASNMNEAQKSTGQENLGVGDPKAQQQALIDEINRTGGLGGRKVVLETYAISATTSNAEQSFNAACAHFTQDAKVFAVITAGPASFGACLEKGGVLHIGSDLTVSTRESTAAQPHGLRPAGIALDDSAKLLVDGLQAQAYFKGSTVGVISFDSPAFQSALDRVLLPRLKSIGHEAKETFLVPTPNSVSDYGQMSSAVSSAVLKFRSEGITHVVIFDQQGRITSFFLPTAEGQGYRPRYGFNSQAGFQAGLTAGSVPREQVQDAVGVGWLPAFDVPAGKRPPSPGAKRCADFFASKGMPASGDNATVIQQFQCQDAWLLDNVMDRLTNDVTREAFVQVVESMGPFLTAANLEIAIDRQRHDGVRVVRHIGWDDGCGCFVYRGGNQRVS